MNKILLYPVFYTSQEFSTWSYIMLYSRPFQMWEMTIVYILVYTREFLCTYICIACYIVNPRSLNRVRI